MMTEDEARFRAESYCSQAERCCSDVTTKLERWQIDPHASARIMAHLVKEGYINEQRYADAYVHDKVRFDHWGRQKISQELWRKRIPSDIAQQALDNINEEEYQQALKAVIDQKRRSVKGRNDYEYSMKLMKSVASRGFEPQIIRKFIDVPEED